MKYAIAALFRSTPVPTHPQLTAADFFSVGKTLYHLSGGSRLHGSNSLPPELQSAVPKIAEFFRTNEKPLAEHIFRQLDMLAADYGSFYDGLFLPVPKLVGCRLGNVAWRVTVHYAPPDRRQLAVGGESRTAYRCGGAYQSDDPVWVEWDETAVGPGRSAPLPVYVQEHAVMRAFERAPIDRPHLVLDGIFTSLRKPIIVDRRGDEVLVKYTLLPTHIGYLAATITGEAVVVRTFLFLTMQGTPEARRLHDRLGLRRTDIEYLRLDRLDTFLDSDLRLDPELTAAFDECGCGDLLRLSNLKEWLLGKRGHARELRHYLGMGGVA